MYVGYGYDDIEPAGGPDGAPASVVVVGSYNGVNVSGGGGVY